MATSLGLGAPRAATSSGSVPSTAQVTQQDNLLHWWKLDDLTDSGETGGATLTQSAAPDYPATQSTNAKFGSAMEFDGTDDYVYSDNSVTTLGSAYSYTAWFRYTGTTTPPANTFLPIVLFNLSSGSGWSTAHMLLMNTSASKGRLQWYFKEGASLRTFNAGSNYITQNDWYFTAFTWSDADNRIEGYWANASDPDASVTKTGGFGVTGAISSNVDSVMIGKSSSLNKYWLGQIDDVRLYDIALSEDDVNDIYGENGAGDF